MLMKEDNTLLTIEEAYLAMISYLNYLYELTDSDTLGGMLGDMCFLDDGVTADPAVWGEWLDAVSKVKDGEMTKDDNLLKLS